MIKGKLLVLAASLLMVSCSMKPCRGPDEQPTVAPKGGKKTEESKRAFEWVYKYDGSKQCEPNSGSSLEKTQLELKGFKVYKSEKRQDNLMRIMVCGAPTGKANVYKIDKSQVSRAEQQGFKVWTFGK